MNLHKNFSNCVICGLFPHKLNFAISPAFKKGCKTDKSNY